MVVYGILFGTPLVKLANTGFIKFAGAALLNFENFKLGTDKGIERRFIYNIAKVIKILYALMIRGCRTKL